MKLLSKITFVLMLSLALVSCKKNSTAAKTSEAGKVAAVKGTTYNVEPGNSKILWIGSKVTGTHNGTVNVKSGEIAYNDGKLTGGNFTIDMGSITVLDLDGDYKADLEAHLRGTGEEGASDFFNTTTYPTAKFEITKATALTNNDDANYIVTGNLTIKDVTKQISFRANVIENNGMVKVTTPEFGIDRTEWGIKYGSAKFFDNLKDRAINDEFKLSVNLLAK